MRNCLLRCVLPPNNDSRDGATSSYFVVFGMWMHTYCDNEVVTHAAKAGFEFVGQMPNWLKPIRILVSAPNKMIAKIGEISNPPSGGIRRRNGRNTGSVNVAIIAVAGLYWPGDIQLRIIRTMIAKVNKFTDNERSLTTVVVAITENSALELRINKISKIARY